MKTRLNFAAILFLTTPMGFSQQSVTAFTAADFPAQVLQYHPVQKDAVTKSAYDKAVNILDGTRKATKGEPGNFTAGDFWNISMAFIKLQEPKENISIAFSKAIESDPKTICGYVKFLGPSRLDIAIPEVFLPFYANCLTQSPSDDKVDPAAYASKNNLDPALVAQIDQIKSDDRRFRLMQPFDAAKQRPFDLQNQQAIEALFAKYKTYIGRSLVGKEYDSVMWAVIQHSDLAMMERFLPVVQKAVADKEIDVIPFKMLIDRVYCIRTKQQIFGSQGEYPLADEKIRTAVQRQYGLTD